MPLYYYCARCKRTLSHSDAMRAKRKMLNLCSFCEAKISGQQVPTSTRAFSSRQSISTILERDRKSGRGKRP